MPLNWPTAASIVPRTVPLSATVFLSLLHSRLYFSFNPLAPSLSRKILIFPAKLSSLERMKFFVATISLVVLLSEAHSGTSSHPSLLDSIRF